MSKRYAFGAIDLLLGLLIISVVFILMMPNLKDMGGGNLKSAPMNYESAQTRANKMIEEIETMRQLSESSVALPAVQE